MPERREPPVELHIAPGQRPGVDRLPTELPAPGVFLVRRIEHRVGLVPDLGGQGRRPQALRLGPDDGETPIALELAAMA
jgi:hypothetical protein